MPLTFALQLLTFKLDVLPERKELTLTPMSAFHAVRRMSRRIGLEPAKQLKEKAFFIHVDRILSK